MQFVLEQSGASGLFCADAYRGFDMLGMAEAIRSSLPGLREIVSLATWDEFLASAAPGQVLPQVAPGDMIQVQYTSGTTGFPRGAMLHHMGLVNEATFVAERAGMGDGGVCVNAMPRRPCQPRWSARPSGCSAASSVSCSARPRRTA